MTITTYPFSLLIQKKVLGLNILGISTLCTHISLELLQTILPLANIISDFFLKNHSLIPVEIIQLKQEITSYMDVDSIGNIGILKGTL